MTGLKRRADRGADRDPVVGSYKIGPAGQVLTAVSGEIKSDCLVSLVGRALDTRVEDRLARGPVRAGSKERIRIMREMRIQLVCAGSV